MEVTSAEKVFEQIYKERIFSIDLETSGLDVHKDSIEYVSLATKKLQTAFEYWEYQPQLKKLLSQKDLIAVFHNAKFDLQFLRKFSFDVKNRIMDTMILAWLLDENRKKYGLKKLVREFLPDNEVIEFDEANSLFSKGMEYYAALDARNTYDLYVKLYAEIEEENLTKPYWEIESPIIRIITNMEYDGIRLNERYVKNILVKIRAEIEQILNILKNKYGDINYDSPTQLAELLFKKMKFSPIMQTKTGYSTNQETLEVLYARTKHEILKYLLRLRKLYKLESTFLSPLSQYGNEVHPSYSQTGTVTGRFSSSSPNFQNMPRGDELPEYKVRSAFIPRPGHKFICIDFSQIELRMLAHYSADPLLREAYIKGKDIHQETADACKCSRVSAKCLNFGVVYGMGIKTLAKKLGTSYEEAQRFHSRFFNNYKGIKRLYQGMKDVLAKRNWIRLLSGRKRRFNNLTDDYRDVSRAVNSLIQGSSADLMKISMVKLHEEFPDIKIIGQVHDEILIEVPEDKAEELAPKYVEIMENAVKLAVPVKAKYVICNNSWQEAK